jgi:hypothetical protein
MTMPDFRVNAGVVWEKVGADIVALDSTSDVVHRLAGDHAAAFLAVAEGDVVRPSSPVLIELQEIGLVSVQSHQKKVSRRLLLTGVAATSGLTIIMPSAAIATSNPSATSNLIVFTGPDIARLSGDWRTDDSNEVFVQFFFGPPGTNPSIEALFIEGEPWTVVLEPYENNAGQTVTPPALTGSLESAGNDYFELYLDRRTGNTPVLTPKPGITLTGTLSRGNIRIGPISFIELE